MALNPTITETDWLVVIVGVIRLLRHRRKKRALAQEVPAKVIELPLIKQFVPNVVYVRSLPSPMVMMMLMVYQRKTIILIIFIVIGRTIFVVHSSFFSRISYCLSPSSYFSTLDLKTHLIVLLFLIRTALFLNLIICIIIFFFILIVSYFYSKKVIIECFILKLVGIGDWGLGIGPNPQSPIPNPQISCSGLCSITNSCIYR